MVHFATTAHDINQKLTNRLGGIMSSRLEGNTGPNIFAQVMGNFAL